MASSISPWSSRISGGIQERPKAEYTLSSVSPATFESSRKIPYSFNMRPRFCAIVRRWMLWSFDPVSYWRAAPQLPGSTIRRSTWINRPSALRRTTDLDSPAARTSRTPGIVVNASATARGSSVVARMSMSYGLLHPSQAPGRHELFDRRSLPQMVGHHGRDRVRVREEEHAFPFLEQLDAAKDFFFRLLAEPLDAAEPV